MCGRFSDRVLGGGGIRLSDCRKSGNDPPIGYPAPLLFYTPDKIMAKNHTRERVSITRVI